MATAVSTQFARYDSIWSATTELPTYPRLDRDLVTDVVVVGGGIAGMSVGYHLARAGRSVVVLDDGPVGIVESRRGTENARLAAESHRAAIERIATIAETEHIDCDFERRDGYLFLPPGEKIATLESELA